MRRVLEIGDIVKLKKAMLGNNEGDHGVVYEIYYLIPEERGVSVMFENGEYDGFSPNEQLMYLERCGHAKSVSGYHFVNVNKLTKDFDDGVFEEAFE